MTTIVTTALVRASAPRDTSAPIVANDSPELRRCWHPIARSAEISSEPRKFWLLGSPLVAYRVAGNAIVLHDQCPHRRAPLSLGTLVGGAIECAYHGWRFDVDGSCVAVPSLPTGPLPSTARVDAPRTVERDGLVFVALEDPLVELPTFGLRESATCRVVELEPYSGRYSAAQLIDNQIDFSHFAFVHRTTFGVAEQPTTPRYEIDRDDWGFRVTAEVPINATNDPAAKLGDRPIRQYRIMNYRYVAPFFVEISIEYPMSGTSMVVSFFAQPERVDQARLFVTFAFSDTEAMSDAELADRVEFERRVVAEDFVLQAGFDELELPLAIDAECHVRADRASLEYRRILATLFSAARVGDTRAR